MSNNFPVLPFLGLEVQLTFMMESMTKRTNIEKICHEIKIKSFTPIWHKNQEMLLKEQINAGFKFIIVGLFAYGFDKTWLGKIIDNERISDFLQLGKKYKINIAGEGGEFF